MGQQLATLTTKDAMPNIKFENKLAHSICIKTTPSLQSTRPNDLTSPNLSLLLSPSNARFENHAPANRRLVQRSRSETTDQRILGWTGAGHDVARPPLLAAPGRTEEGGRVDTPGRSITRAATPGVGALGVSNSGASPRSSGGK